MKSEIAGTKLETNPKSEPAMFVGATFRRCLRHSFLRFVSAFGFDASDFNPHPENDSPRLRTLQVVLFQPLLELAERHEFGRLGEQAGCER